MFQAIVVFDQSQPLNHQDNSYYFKYYTNCCDLVKRDKLLWEYSLAHTFHEGIRTEITEYFLKTILEYSDETGLPVFYCLVEKTYRGGSGVVANDIVLFDFEKYRHIGESN